MASRAHLHILLAAQARGWSLVYFEMPDIWLRDGVRWTWRALESLRRQEALVRLGEPSR